MKKASHSRPKRKSTVYMLGAGASYSSPAPEAKLPLQKGFFAHVFGSGLGPLLVQISHLIVDPLAEWLVANGLTEATAPDRGLAKNWELNIEDLYAQIESDSNLKPSKRAACLKLLDRIVFMAVSMPTVGLRNHPDRACPYHRRLAERLSPGDRVISFNYDCLVDDALLAFCPYWHPLTGYGIRFEHVLGGTLRGKEDTFDSTVQLFKPHGSVTFS